MMPPSPIGKEGVTKTIIPTKNEGLGMQKLSFGYSVCLFIINKLSKRSWPPISVASTSSKIHNMVNTITVKLDSGATQHYLKKKKKKHQNILHDHK